MVADDYVSTTNPNKPALKGMIAKYPEAFIEFRLTVAPDKPAAGKEPPTPSSTTSKARIPESAAAASTADATVKPRKSVKNSFLTASVGEALKAKVTQPQPTEVEPTEEEKATEEVKIDEPTPKEDLNVPEPGVIEEVKIEEVKVEEKKAEPESPVPVVEEKIAEPVSVPITKVAVEKSAPAKQQQPIAKKTEEIKKTVVAATTPAPVAV